MDLHTEGRGLIYIFTGNGKGKTSAALGVAMRAVGHGKRVAMVQWYKERRWKIGEHNLSLMLKRTNEQTNKRTKKTTGTFEIYPMGEGFYRLPTDHATPSQHCQAAQEAMELAAKLLKGKMVKMDTMAKMAENSNHFDHSSHSGHLFLLVLDEVLNAVNDGLISQISLIRLIRQRNATHIILTGRNAPKELIDMADLVTEMKNVKHPYDSGKKAVLGLDF